MGKANLQDVAVLIPSLDPDELMVALFKINDYFVENFSGAFDNEEDMAVNCVYKINKETKLLELCE